MSKFKKMKLIPFDGEPQTNLESNLKNIVTYETSAPIKQMSELDNEIESILNSKIDMDTKSKLYSDSLRKFLNVKRKYNQTDKKNKTPICVDIDTSDQMIKTTQKPVKRKRIIKKTETKLIKKVKSNKKRNIQPKINSFLIKKRKPSEKQVSKDYLLKPSQMKSFIKSIESNNGPNWIEY